VRLRWDLHSSSFLFFLVAHDVTELGAGDATYREREGEGKGEGGEEAGFCE
jgi:hypothetical protein